jgi:NAD(P)H-hydrate epimerase
MKILSAAEMQACDRLTSEQFGIASPLSSTDLMRNSARAIAAFVRLQFPAGRRIVILCGRGNNGGDGLMAARLLNEAGCEVTVLLLGDPEGLRGDAAIAWNELTADKEFILSGLPSRLWSVIAQPEDLAGHAETLSKADLILDAVVGTGFKPSLRGLPLATLEWLKSAPTLPPILAIDLPSGWDADSTAATAENAYPADAVITFTAPKQAHVFGQLTRSIRQPIVAAAIGSPEEAVVSALNLHWAGSAKSITDAERPADSNKGMYGHVLVVGGSPGKSGAPAMASLAALRTGAGLVTAAVTPSVQPLVAGIAPELMTRFLRVTRAGEISLENTLPGPLKSLLKGITVLAIGPGLGTDGDVPQMAIGLLMLSRLPAVADADALNAIAAQREHHPDLLCKLAEGRTLVITPHPGEMSRLTGRKTAEIQANRLEIAREFATKNQLTLVLKGWRTLIAHPDGSVAVNTTGNPGMAKGGSGDLLTGMVAAMLAQYPKDPKLAVEAAVYLHGLAADITVQSPGIGGNLHTLLATDSLANLYTAFHYHPRAASGNVWLQGSPADAYLPRAWQQGAS